MPSRTSSNTSSARASFFEADDGAADAIRANLDGLDHAHDVTRVVIDEQRPACLETVESDCDNIGGNRVRSRSAGFARRRHATYASPPAAWRGGAPATPARRVPRIRGARPSLMHRGARGSLGLLPGERVPSCTGRRPSRIPVRYACHPRRGGARRRRGEVRCRWASAQVRCNWTDIAVRTARRESVREEPFRHFPMVLI